MKNLRLLFFACFLGCFVPVSSYAQVTVAPFTNARVTFLTNTNGVASGYCLFTFQAGTSTQQATYSDLGVTLNANPVILDGTGSAVIYLQLAAYKFQLKSPGGVNCASGSSVWTQDNVNPSTPLTSFAGLVSTGAISVNSPTAATSLANQSGPNTCFDGNYWTGSASAVDSWCWNDSLGTGSNPTSTLVLTHAGSSGTQAITLPAATTIPSATITGALTSGSSNGVINVTTLTCAGLQTALATCSAAGGGVVDARGITGSQACSSTITLPTHCGLWLTPPATFTSTSDPEICFNTDTFIDGGAGELGSGTFASFQNSAGGSRVLAPCTANPRTLDFYVRGIDFWCTSGTCTVPVLDLTGLSRGRFDNIAVQHSSTGTNSTGPLISIVPATGADAFYNLFTGIKLQGNGGSGPGVKLAATAASGANGNQFVGGSIVNVGDALQIDGTNAQVNGTSLIGTVCEAQSAACIHTIANVAGVIWSSARWESSSGAATLFNISANSTQIEAVGIEEYGSQTCGTTNSFVSLIGWPLGSPCAPASTDIASANNVSASSFSTLNSGVTSTFTNNANANDAVTVTSNATGNGGSFAIINSAASGHTWRLGETVVGVGRFDLRDITQTGHPSFGFQVTGTAGNEGLFTHAITANRTWTMPDLSSGVPVVFSCGSTGSGSQTCAPAAATVKTQIYNGESTLAANAATITFPNGFTSATSYFCVANDVTTRANPVQMIPASATTATITNTTGATDVIQWLCIGQ